MTFSSQVNPARWGSYSPDNLLSSLSTPENNSIESPPPGHFPAPIHNSLELSSRQTPQNAASHPLIPPLVFPQDKTPIRSYPLTDSPQNTGHHTYLATISPVPRTITNRVQQKDIGGPQTYQYHSSLLTPLSHKSSIITHQKPQPLDEFRYVQMIKKGSAERKASRDNAAQSHTESITTTSQSLIPRKQTISKQILTPLPNVKKPTQKKTSNTETVSISSVLSVKTVNPIKALREIAISSPSPQKSRIQHPVLDAPPDYSLTTLRQHHLAIKLSFGKQYHDCWTKLKETSEKYRKELLYSHILSKAGDHRKQLLLINRQKNRPRRAFGVDTIEIGWTGNQYMLKMLEELQKKLSRQLIFLVLRANLTLNKTRREWIWKRAISENRETFITIWEAWSAIIDDSRQKNALALQFRLKTTRQHYPELLRESKECFIQWKIWAHKRALRKNIRTQLETWRNKQNERRILLTLAKSKVMRWIKLEREMLALELNEIHRKERTFTQFQISVHHKYPRFLPVKHTARANLEEKRQTLLKLRDFLHLTKLRKIGEQFRQLRELVQRDQRRHDLLFGGKDERIREREEEKRWMEEKRKLKEEQTKQSEARRKQKEEEERRTREHARELERKAEEIRQEELRNQIAEKKRQEANRREEKLMKEKALSKKEQSVQVHMTQARDANNDVSNDSLNLSQTLSIHSHSSRHPTISSIHAQSSPQSPTHVSPSSIHSDSGLPLHSSSNLDQKQDMSRRTQKSKYSLQEPTSRSDQSQDTDEDSEEKENVTNITLPPHISRDDVNENEDTSITKFLSLRGAFPPPPLPNLNETDSTLKFLFERDMTFRRKSQRQSHPTVEDLEITPIPLSPFHEWLLSVLRALILQHRETEKRLTQLLTLPSIIRSVLHSPNFRFETSQEHIPSEINSSHVVPDSLLQHPSISKDNHDTGPSDEHEEPDSSQNQSRGDSSYSFVMGHPEKPRFKFDNSKSSSDATDSISLSLHLQQPSQNGSLILPPTQPQPRFGLSHSHSQPSSLPPRPAPPQTRHQPSVPSHLESMSLSFSLIGRENTREFETAVQNERIKRKAMIKMISWCRDSELESNCVLLHNFHVLTSCLEHWKEKMERRREFRDMMKRRRENTLHSVIRTWKDVVDNQIRARAQLIERQRAEEEEKRRDEDRKRELEQQLEAEKAKVTELITASLQKRKGRRILQAWADVASMMRKEREQEEAKRLEREERQRAADEERRRKEKQAEEERKKKEEQIRQANQRKKEEDKRKEEERNKEEERRNEEKKRDEERRKEAARKKEEERRIEEQKIEEKKREEERRKEDEKKQEQERKQAAAREKLEAKRKLLEAQVQEERLKTEERQKEEAKKQFDIIRSLEEDLRREKEKRRFLESVQQANSRVRHQSEANQTNRVEDEFFPTPSTRPSDIIRSSISSRSTSSISSFELSSPGENQSRTKKHLPSTSVIPTTVSLPLHTPSKQRPPPPTHTPSQTNISLSPLHTPMSHSTPPTHSTHDNNHPHLRPQNRTTIDQSTIPLDTHPTTLHPTYPSIGASTFLSQPTTILQAFPVGEGRTLDGSMSPAPALSLDTLKGLPFPSHSTMKLQSQSTILGQPSFADRSRTRLLNSTTHLIYPPFLSYPDSRQIPATTPFNQGESILLSDD
ncbi:hypothetical protein BLNAU_4551 [Blattamonas nauphoetae]|uniref:Sfi1 spindle body domain-containing protein n=1 Tax=Blattamonas nauphoetae TaxID=2049346 RepID=A0ABQ9Y9K9_9EUKA|nr:hypothetical protein BLNAU_4551 [Blattamonas nauphoetae]